MCIRDRFKKIGSKTEELEVKLFGGAEMITNGGKKAQVIQVGRMNVEMAMKKLKGLGLELKSYDIGGTLGRRLFFDTSSGEVWVKRLAGGSVSLFEKKDIHKQTLMQLDG